MSKCLDILEKIKNQISKEDYDSLRQMILYGEQYIGLNRCWNRCRGDQRLKNNLTTTKLMHLFGQVEAYYRMEQENFNKERMLKKDVLDELKANKGRIIDDELLEDFIFNLAIGVFGTDIY